MSQKEMILNHMLEKGSITQMDAIVNYGCTRLSAVIFLLKKDGVPIKTESESKENRFGKKTTYTRYFIAKEVTDGN